jgi:hypothetical protein
MGAGRGKGVRTQGITKGTKKNKDILLALSGISLQKLYKESTLSENEKLNDYSMICRCNT